MDIIIIIRNNKNAAEYFSLLLFKNYRLSNENSPTEGMLPNKK